MARHMTPEEMDNHPVYIAQRPYMTTSFTGKEAEIAHQFAHYQQEESHKPRHKVWTGKALVEDDKAKIIGNHASFDVIQYQDKPSRASMSMIHLLAYPIEVIYNGVLLTRDNVCIIDHMIKLFKEAWAKPEVRQAVLQHQLDMIEMRDEQQPDPASKAIALRHWEELRSSIDDVSVDDFQYGFHLRPDNSIDYLHMHILLSPEKYRRYSTSLHDKKTKDAYEVRDFVLKSE